MASESGTRARHTGWGGEESLAAPWLWGGVVLSALALCYVSRTPTGSGLPAGLCRVHGALCSPRRQRWADPGQLWGGG